MKMDIEDLAEAYLEAMVVAMVYIVDGQMYYTDITPTSADGSNSPTYYWMRPIPLHLVEFTRILIDEAEDSGWWDATEVEVDIKNIMNGVK